jgi:hypothetical protein
LRVFLCAGLLAGAAGAPASAGPPAAGCSAGARPAATLLFPYFEVDVTDAGGRSTLIAVGNAAAEPALARVVLWTDWGIPTLAFDLYLAADDLQTINLRDVFAGVLPTTGGPGVPGCTGPVANPALGPEEVAALRRKHTGQPDGEGLCFGRGRLGPAVANGYLTVDALNRCAATPRYPSDDGYFAAGGTGVASNDNVLYGDFFLVDPGEDFAQGSEAVHVVADAERFGDAWFTFYSGFLPIEETPHDARAPLGSGYRARYLNGGGFDGGTDLVIWAEPRFSVLEPSECGRRAEHLALRRDCAYLNFDRVDEDGQDPWGPFGRQTTEVVQKFAVGGPELQVFAPFGAIDVSGSTQSCAFPFFGPTLQTWVLPLHKASGRFSVGLAAVRTDDELCAAGQRPSGDER